MKVTVFSGANLAAATNEVLKTARENVGLAPTFIIVPDRFTLQAERILLSNGNNPFHKREMQEKQKDNEERMCQQPDNVHENLDDSCRIDGGGIGGSGGGGIGGSGGGGDGVGVGAVGGGDGGDGVGAVGGGGGSGGAMLNTRVVTFSMLFSVLADELTGGREVNIIDKTTAVLYLWRAIKSVKLEWFGGSAKYFDFAEKMFNTINQIKSSLVGFDELESMAKTEIARSKFRDIVAVHKKYTELLAADGAVDSSGMLKYLIDNVRNSSVFKNARFYVCGFENLSKARLKVLAEICEMAADVYIGSAVGSEFDSQIGNIKKHANNITITSELPGNKLQGLFSYNFAKAKLNLDNFCEVGVFDTVRTEAEQICNRVLHLAQSGIRLRNITILLADFENTATIWEAVFNGNGVGVNIDVGKRLTEFAITKYMHELISLKINPNAENTVATIFNSHSGIDTETLFAKENEIIAKNKWATNVDGVYILSATDLAGLCDELDKIADTEEQEFVRKKLKKILETIKNSGVALSLAEFGELFWTLATASKVSNIPLYYDRVLIAPVDDFVPTAVPYLFIANCADGVLPKAVGDDELLLERDTRNTEISPKPSEQQKRNREHIVIIMTCVIQHIVVSSYSVNVAGENVNRGMVISNLQAMGAGDFKYDKIATKGLATLRLLERGDDYPTYCSALNMDFAVQGCKADGGEAPQIGTAQIVTPDNGEMPESGAVQSCKAGGDEIIKSATNEVRAGGEVPQNKKIPSTTGQKVIPIITCGEELFFAHKTVKPTMVEKFYSCPYLNFIDNGLKIRQRELYELKPNIIGSIIHKIIEIYFGAITKNEKVTVEYAIDTVFADERYKRYCDDERNMPLIVALKKEVAFIIDKLQKNLEECSFRPFAVEYEIKKPLDNGYLLHGRIDRVDRFVGPDGRPHYVIIDYKTGAVDSGLPKKIYMGEKLQLPIYASYFANMGDVTGDVTEQKNETLYSGHKIDHKIVTGDVTEQKSESAAIQNGGESYSEITQNIQNSTHEHEIGTICGAGYLPLVKGFASVEKNFQLYGFFDKDWATLFGEKVGINKNGIINTDPRKGQLISGETIRAICKYADKMVDSAVKKIIKGYIAPNPVEKMVCEYCSVRSLCPECENVRRGGVRVGFDSFTGKRNVKEEFIELQIQLVLNEDNNKADSKKYGKDSIKENNNAESKGSIKENNNAEGKDGIKENNKECAVSGKEDKEEYSKAMCGGKCNEKNSEARGEKETRGEK